MKNVYENELFKIEDEMYKQDFEIANTYNTLRVLEEEKIRIENMT